MTAELAERTVSTVTVPAEQWTGLVQERDRLRAEVAMLRATQRLTPTQRVVLTVVRDFITRHGQAPTMQEIAAAAGLSAATNAYYHLRVLEREGFLRRVKHKARGIELIAEADRG